MNILNGGQGLAELIGAVGPLYQMLTSMFGAKPNAGSNGQPAGGADISEAWRGVTEAEKAAQTAANASVPNR